MMSPTKSYMYKYNIIMYVLELDFHIINFVFLKFCRIWHEGSSCVMIIVVNRYTQKNWHKIIIVIGIKHRTSQ